MGLEQMVNDMTKTMVISDLHGSFVDEDALLIAEAYMRDYKPDRLIINGDMLDFYSLSVFDKNPERKYSFQEELQKGREILAGLKKAVGKDCEIVYIEGNHENRLQKFIWRNPELEGLTELKIEQLLKLKNFGIKFVGVDNDYWRQTNGHYKVGDAIITHGDNRTNGCSTSRYAGYSAKNTMTNLQTSVMLGHTHRMAIVNHSTPYKELTGVECGCLCQKSGTANWQQGFVTFETNNGKNVNYRMHKINNGVLVNEQGVYYVE